MWDCVLNVGIGISSLLLDVHGGGRWCCDQCGGRVMSGGRICSENQEFMISVLICLFWS